MDIKFFNITINNYYLKKIIIFLNICSYKMEQFIQKIKKELQQIIIEYDVINLIKMFFILFLIMVICAQALLETSTSHMPNDAFWELVHDVNDAIDYNAKQEEVLKIQHKKMTQMAEIIKENTRYQYTLGLALFFGGCCGVLIGIILENITRT